MSEAVAPLVSRPTVLYYGKEATALQADWNDLERPYELLGIDRSQDRPMNVRPVDAVVVDVDEVDVPAVLEWVEEVAGPVPTVVVTTAETPTFDSMVLAEADSMLTVTPDCDRGTILTELAPLLEELILDRRDQSILNSLLAHIPMSVYFKDRAGRHIAVSDTLLSMIGPPYIENGEGKRHHHPADLIGKSDFDLYTEELAAETAADDRQVVESEQSIENRIEDSYDERGRGTLVTTSKAPWYDHNGDVGGVVGVTQDITERKQFEYQLQRQNRRLRRLTTMVSHDIRNPLSAAVGRLDLAQQTGDREHFKTVERSLERIERLVDSLLDVTRQGAPATETDHLTLATLAESVWEAVEPEQATLRTPTEETIVAEAERLRLLLEHLFENALVHGRDTTATEMTVTVGDLDDAEGFYVEDDGTGIPADDRATLLEPGLSAADSSGTGLNVIAAIADAHGWTVEVSESDAGGARFEFSDVRLVGA